MPESESCGCRSRALKESFDAKQAFERLSKKHAEIADLMARYMSQSGLERGVRTTNAQELVTVLQRIIGGKRVPPGDFPECCLIGQSFSNKTMGWFCTGVLVHPRIVLTAAHCHDSLGPQANVVALSAEDEDNLGNAEIVRARRTVIHPDYPLTGRHDIAVMILKRSADTAPVAVASTKELRAAMETQLVGFGNDDVQSTRGFGIKREVKVPIVHLRRSKNDDLGDVEDILDFESDVEFVAGGDGFDSCNGDSGGPAYIDAGERKVAGLTSRGFRTANNPCGDGGIYTRIDMNMDFVRQVAGDAGIDLS